MNARTLLLPAIALSLACASPGFAQTATPPALPDAPAVSASGQPASGAQTPAPADATQVTGKVVDVQNNPVPNATVTLIPLGHFGERTAAAAQDGTFSFSAVPAGRYHLSVTAQGLEPFASPEFVVRANTPLALPDIALRISTTTSVSVVASPQQIALAQVHEQETQRVFGVFQNFYTSYIWDAEPMPAKQKYTLALRSLIDPPQFLIVAGIAGAEQYNGTYSGYGPGLQGYGKRYGAALADELVGRMIGSAIMPSLLHQDPRYFYQGSGSVASRALHAAAFTFVARGDNGNNQINYSHLLGELGAAGVSNLYHPADSRGVTNTFQDFGVNLAANIAGNMFREFVLRHLESIPSFASGKRATPSRTQP